MTLLEQALARLRAEYQAARKEAEFDQLKGTLTAERGAIPYAELAAQLNLPIFNGDRIRAALTR